MSEKVFSRGFRGRRQQSDVNMRLPPGQYLENGFPVLSAGPTPHSPLEAWDFSIFQGSDQLKRWTWDEFRALPHETITADIHCVTKWSKLDTHWEGVSVDTLLAQINHAPSPSGRGRREAPGEGFLMASSDGGYTTNLPLEDVVGGKAWVAYAFEAQPLPAEHGGPARLLIPHLYFWKSAKWVRGLRLMDKDEPGFWESLGYNNHGDPWKEERYWGD
jgi:DMSO/TMAO reductase YedYZ molybdopterin-dependent catalytic subunit